MISTALLAAAALAALSTFRGIQPGVSTRAEVERVLGAAAARGGSAEYQLADQSGTVRIEYRGDIAEEIEYRLSAIIDRAEAVQILKVPEPVLVQTNAGSGRIEEFFESPHTLVLVHATASRNSGIQTVRYLSRERHQTVLNPNGGPPPPTQPDSPAQPPPLPQQPPPPTYTEVRTRFDPAACRPLYDWARSEAEAANKSKNAERRQAIIEIRIQAQRGDCAAARDLASKYKTRFQ